MNDQKWVWEMEDLKKGRHPQHKKIKMYILIKDYLPVGHAINCACHATAAVMIKYRGDPVMQEWEDDHFYKVACKVTPEQFEEFKKFDDHVVIKEGNFNNEEMTIGFKPRLETDFPPEFKKIPLYK